MVFIPIILGIFLLLFLITFIKLDTFISFILVCLFVGIVGGLPLEETVTTVQLGIGKTLGSLVIILGFGAMLGKLIAESGAADKITHKLVAKFGLKNIQFSLILVGFIIGIPLFYTVGFVILVPFAIALASKTKLPLLYLGLPMLASLSVTHGFLPPHPAPTAIAGIYGAALDKTMIYGAIVGIPAILAAKFLLSGTMNRLAPKLKQEFIVSEANAAFKPPNLTVSLIISLLPVILIAGSSLYHLIFNYNPIINWLGNPAIAMLCSVLAGIYFLGIRTGRNMSEIMIILKEAVSSIAMVLLIIAGAGAFKQIMIATEISLQIGAFFESLGLSPIILAWLIAAIIRIIVGSATVAGLTAAGIMLPMVESSGIAPELLVLATGAGSIFCSHINDSGFWLFKEYFNMSIGETLQSWTVMESIVSLVGLMGILILNLIV